MLLTHTRQLNRCSRPAIDCLPHVNSVVMRRLLQQALWWWGVWRICCEDSQHLTLNVTCHVDLCWQQRSCFICKTSKQSNVSRLHQQQKFYHIKPHFFMANCRQYASHLCELIWMFYVVSFLFKRHMQTESNDLVTLLQNVFYLRHSTCCTILPGCTAFLLYVMAPLTHCMAL